MLQEIFKKKEEEKVNSDKIIYDKYEDFDEDFDEDESEEDYNNNDDNESHYGHSDNDQNNHNESDKSEVVVKDILRDIEEK